VRPSSCFLRRARRHYNTRRSSHLPVSLASGCLALLSFDDTSRRFVTLQRLADSGGWQLCADSSSRLVASASLSGDVSLFRVDNQRRLQPLHSLHTGGCIWSCAFAEHAGARHLLCLSALQSDSGSGSPSPRLVSYALPDAPCDPPPPSPGQPWIGCGEDALALLSVPVPSPLCLAIGASSLSLACASSGDALQHGCTRLGRPLPLAPSDDAAPSLPCAWAWAPQHSLPASSALLALGLDCGAILAVSVTSDGDLKLQCRADPSRGAPSAIAWLPDGSGVLLWTRGGCDGEVILFDGAQSKGEQLCSAPVVDACVHCGDGGERLLLACGGGAHGSLLSLRPGLQCRLEGGSAADCESGAAGFETLTGLWTLPVPRFGEHTIALLSFAEATRCLLLPPAGRGGWADCSAELADAGLLLAEQTLLAAALEDECRERRLVQVSPACAVALSQPPSAHRPLSAAPVLWRPPAGERIACTAACSSLLLLSLAPSAKLHLLALRGGTWAQLFASPAQEEEPSSLALSVCGSFAAVGSYAPSVRVYRVSHSADGSASLELLSQQSLKSGAVPHSLAFLLPDHLLTSTRTGALLCFCMSASALCSTHQLAASPLSLHPLPCGSLLALAESPGAAWLIQRTEGAQLVSVHRLALEGDACPRHAASLVAGASAERVPLLLVDGAKLTLLSLPELGSARAQPGTEPLMHIDVSAPTSPSIPLRLAPYCDITLLAYQMSELDGRYCELAALAGSPPAVPVSEMLRLRPGETPSSLATWRHQSDNGREDELVAVGTDAGRLLVLRVAVALRGSCDKDCSGEWTVLAEALLPDAVSHLVASGDLLLATSACSVHSLGLHPLRARCAPLRLRSPVKGIAWMDCSGSDGSLLALADRMDGVHIAQWRPETEGQEGACFLKLLASERRPRPAQALAAAGPCGVACLSLDGTLAFFQPPSDLAAEAPAPLRPIATVALGGAPTLLRASSEPGALFVLGLSGCVQRVRPFMHGSAEFHWLRRVQAAMASHPATMPIFGGAAELEEADQSGALNGDALSQLLVLPRTVQAALVSQDEWGLRETLALLERELA